MRFRPLLVRSSLFAALTISFAQPASAATFIVNAGGTVGDGNPGDGICETTPGAGDCSFTGAIQETNALAGADAIAIPPGIIGWPQAAVTDAVVISGAGAANTIVQGSSGDTVMGFDSVSVTLVGMTIAGGTGGNVGGGITNYSGHLTVIDCIIRDNVAWNVGGGIYNQGGRLTLVGSTVTNNRAGNVGGGVYNDSHAEIINSTISGNHAGNTSGGIGNEGWMRITNATIVDNSCGNVGAGIDNDFETSQPLILRNSIVANNYRKQLLSTDKWWQDLYGSIDSHGYNLISTSPGGAFVARPTDLVGPDPLLGPLADNGGPTPTHALLDGSPAINAGNPDVPGSGGDACPDTDQRRLDRPGGLVCDIGAFELQRCGNGTIDPEEECDDGDNIDGDGCDSNCTVTRCGNGVTSDGEECDDANTRDGDCCTAVCTIPELDPTVPAAAGGAKFDLRAGSSNKPGPMKFQWKSASGVDPATFGDPLAGTDVSLCVYDLSGAAPRLLAAASIPGGAGWQATGTGFRFRSRAKTPGTVRALTLQGGTVGKIAAKALAPRLRSGALPLVAPVWVQVMRSDGVATWGAEFTASQHNSRIRFKAVSR